MDAKRLLQLQLMGFTCWRERRPKLFENLQAAGREQASTDALLVVSSASPEPAQQRLIGNVLAALARPGATYRVVHDSPGSQRLQEFNGLIWYAGVPHPEPHAGIRLLSSPPLSELLVSPRAKRALWRQMLSYV